MTSTEGYHWTPEDGIRAGNLETLAVVDPPSFGDFTSSSLLDVIVIGAGYAGLEAARDIALTGQSVVLLEARDRLGGRAWSATVDGTIYEMGGTWVTDKMGYLYRNMCRYGFENDLIVTRNSGFENDYYTVDVEGSPRLEISHEEFVIKVRKAWDLFVDVDGHAGRLICPLPHSSLDNPRIDRVAVQKLDNMSCRQRLDEIKDQLTAQEEGILHSLLIHISGSTLEKSSLWDMIKSHSMMAWDSTNFGPVWFMYKLRQGQSALARAMFDEAVSAGLQYSFSAPITSIDDQDCHVQVTTAKNQIFKASRVISTIPLNVLHTINFLPPLSEKRQEAIQLQQVNHMNKIHYEVEGSGLTSWSGCKFPGRLLYAYGDGRVNNGNAHIVAFGADHRHDFVPEKDPKKALEALDDIHKVDVKRMVFANWNTDPYSQGGPAWYSPGFGTKYQGELQKRHGNIFFASADWANGWRGAIDGALEQGSLAAYRATSEIRELKKMQANGQ
ncbi:amine oxidase [Meredithblackwellia eburnea MCA 4105]